MSPARRAIIQSSVIPTVSIFRSVQNGAGLGPARAFVTGHEPRPVKRNSQTVLNVAFNGLTSAGNWSPAVAPMFWDLRVRSLEAQALEPIKAVDEMRGGTYPEDRQSRSIDGCLLARSVEASR
jgi:cytochrome c peroxidase